MICSKCRNINNNEDRNFCCKCGALLVRKDKDIEGYKNFYADEKGIENKSRLLKRICTIIAVIAIIIGSFGYTKQRNVQKYISIVKEGTFENHPNIKIGEGFEKFFNDPTWEYVNSDVGYDIVEFNGNFIYNGDEVMTVIKFHIYDSNSFEPNYLSFVDISQDKYILNELIDNVMSNY